MYMHSRAPSAPSFLSVEKLGDALHTHLVGVRNEGRTHRRGRRCPGEDPRVTRVAQDIPANNPAVPTGFEPAISSLTGTYARPLHHGTTEESRIRARSPRAPSIVPEPPLRIKRGGECASFHSPPRRCGRDHDVAGMSPPRSCLSPIRMSRVTSFAMRLVRTRPPSVRSRPTSRSSS
jgi:hypothetical protein